jgi:hypothetical protein
MLKLISLVVSLFKLLGPWGFLAVVVVAAVVLWRIYSSGDGLLESLIQHHARGIGKVLKGATVTTHSVTPAPEPDPSVWRTGDDEDDDEFEEALEESGMPKGEYDWYQIEATIEPQPDAQGKPASWEPTMVHVEKSGKPLQALEFSLDCLIAQVELWRDGHYVTIESGSVKGTGRVKLYVGVTPGTKDVRFNYLGESFGEVRLPARGQSAVASRQ